MGKPVFRTLASKFGLYVAYMASCSCSEDFISTFVLLFPPNHDSRGLSAFSTMGLMAKNKGGDGPESTSWKVLSPVMENCFSVGAGQCISKKDPNPLCDHSCLDLLLIARLFLIS